MQRSMLAPQQPSQISLPAIEEPLQPAGNDMLLTTGGDSDTLHQCGTCPSCRQPWLHQSCQSHRAEVVILDSGIRGGTTPGNAEIQLVRQQDPTPALLEPKEMAVRERQMQREFLADQSLEGTIPERQHLRQGPAVRPAVQSAVMDHQYMLRHIRHQQHVAEGSRGAPTLEWVQLQDTGDSPGVISHMRTYAAAACRACGVEEHSIGDCPLMNVTQPPRVSRRAPPAGASSPKRRRRSMPPDQPVPGLTRDLAALPPAMRDALAAMQQFAVEAAHEQGLSTGEKAKVVAAFSPDALIAAGLFSAKVLRSALQPAASP